ncbi:PREDICTED: gamma-aminobutyric acid type B receptor subunit 1-like [Amphimedon queenslandica]|uniref:Receptor ligand binding region domain-containing protein n=1 Tax=Amphimedon queenslandica TaxID=400682 RepID=A0AAN0J9L0_AMPQE|nr:PREDICTED: gamma-aminobutyric acid type B receptor subunit 1-like [Amphimedon queenslandica]|eukprot:XP_019853725.1 PREDICTED: gamma-aminobutyric acid type B receptor subunit 1-like [Amphimedon queenslandica]
MSPIILVLLFAASSAVVAGSNGSIPLTLSVLLPLSFVHLNGHAYLPAMDISLELINNKTDLLPGYTLKAVVNDSACSDSSGVRSFIDVIFKEPVKIAMVGPICSSSTSPVAELAHFWNLVLISAGATSPSLSNTAVYPTFLRSISVDTAAVEGIIALMKKYGWTRVAAITSQQDLFQAVYSELSQAVLNNNFEEARNFAFGEFENPRATVNSLYNSPFRIIFVNMYPAKAIEIICQVHQYILVHLLNWP